MNLSLTIIFKSCKNECFYLYIPKENDILESDFLKANNDFESNSKEINNTILDIEFPIDTINIYDWYLIAHFLLFPETNLFENMQSNQLEWIYKFCDFIGFIKIIDIYYYYFKFNDGIGFSIKNIEILCLIVLNDPRYSKLDEFKKIHEFIEYLCLNKHWKQCLEIISFYNIEEIKFQPPFFGSIGLQRSDVLLSGPMVLEYLLNNDNSVRSYTFCNHKYYYFVPKSSFEERYKELIDEGFKPYEKAKFLLLKDEKQVVLFPVKNCLKSIKKWPLTIFHIYYDGKYMYISRKVLYDIVNKNIVSIYKDIEDEVMNHFNEIIKDEKEFNLEKLDEFKLERYIKRMHTLNYIETSFENTKNNFDDEDCCLLFNNMNIVIEEINNDFIKISTTDNFTILSEITPLSKFVKEITNECIYKDFTNTYFFINCIVLRFSNEKMDFKMREKLEIGKKYRIDLYLVHTKLVNQKVTFAIKNRINSFLS